MSASQRRAGRHAAPGYTPMKDASSFGRKMLEKMGWSEGKGLGKNLEGRAEHVKVKQKDDVKGLGADTQVFNDHWWDDAFKSSAKRLQNIGGDLSSSSSESESSGSDEERCEASKRKTLKKCEGMTGNKHDAPGKLARIQKQEQELLRKMKKRAAGELDEEAANSKRSKVEENGKSENGDSKSDKDKKRKKKDKEEKEKEDKASADDKKKKEKKKKDKENDKKKKKKKKKAVVDSPGLRRSPRLAAKQKEKSDMEALKL